MPTAVELRDELQGKRKQLVALMAAKPNSDYTDDEIRDFRARNEELNDLGRKYDLLDIDETRERLEKEQQADDRRPVNRLPSLHRTRQEILSGAKSVGDLMSESASWQARKGGATSMGAIEIPDETLARETGFKTLLTQANWTFLTDRQPAVQPSILLDVTISNLIRQSTTDSPVVSYMAETTFTNAAAAVAEGGTKPESALAYTETQESVRKLATNLPITDEMLQDNAQMEGIVRGRLVDMVIRAREIQLYSGNGTAPNLRGITQRVGIQTGTRAALGTSLGETAAASTIAVAIFAAITNVMVNAGANPNAIIIHPTNWAAIRTAKDTTGNFLWGPPSENGADRVWGIRTVVSAAATVNTALVGDFSFAEIFRRTGLTVTASTEHSTFFVENKVMLQAEERLALAVYRPSAFHLITALQTP